MRLWILVALGCALLASPASAGGVNGNYLLTDCGTGPTETAALTWQDGYCSGYVSALADVYVETRLICPTPGVTYGQYIDIVIKYLVDHPESRNQEADGLLLLAFQGAFPCKPAH